MTLTEQEADARQAAYFRSELVVERRHLVDGIRKRRSILDRRAHSSGLRAQVRAAEKEVRRLDLLIARLDHRFPPEALG